MTTLVREIPIALKVPVDITGADGQSAVRDTITLYRPKVAEAKRLAALIGPALVHALMSDGDLVSAVKRDRTLQPEATANVDMVAIFTDVSSKLLTEDGLGVLIHLVASMTRQNVEFIEALDLLDLMEIGKAMLRFFPALQSLAHKP